MIPRKFWGIPNPDGTRRKNAQKCGPRTAWNNFVPKLGTFSTKSRSCHPGATLLKIFTTRAVRISYFLGFSGLVRSVWLLKFLINKNYKIVGSFMPNIFWEINSFNPMKYFAYDPEFEEVKTQKLWFWIKINDKLEIYPHMSQTVYIRGTKSLCPWI